MKLKAVMQRDEIAEFISRVYDRARSLKFD